MKKTKLLASAITLCLVLSLSACNSENCENENINENDTSIDFAENPSQLIQKALDVRNYSVQITCDYWTSNGTISYNDYIAAASGYGTSSQVSAYESLFTDTSILSSVLLDLYVSDDYLLIYIYELDSNDSYQLTNVNLLYNYTAYTFAYYQYDALTDYWDVGLYYGDWESYYFSLFDCYVYNLDSIFIYDGVATYDGESCTTYSINSSAGYFGFDYYFMNMLGAFWCTHQFSLLNYYYYWTYFFTNSQKMTSSYFYGGLLSTGIDSNYYYVEDDLNFTLYDVGNTDQSDVVLSIYQNIF